MRQIALSELPTYSPWPARLLGLEPLADPVVRTPERVLQEYEDEKYGPLLVAVENDPSTTLDDVRARALREPGREVAASIGVSLYAMSLDRAVARSADVHLRYVGYVARPGMTLVDLGCGYGYLLDRIRRSHLGSGLTLRGGDLAPSAVALARHFGFEADGFSFLGEKCAPLEAAEFPVVVVTAFALHQLASAEPAVRLLERYREKIAAVVCLEPERDAFGGDLLGLLRRRYGEVNGYSADLGRVLRRRDDVVIEFLNENAVGTNALLPGTITTWRFR